MSPEIRDRAKPKSTNHCWCATDWRGEIIDSWTGPSDSFEGQLDFLERHANNHEVTIQEFIADDPLTARRAFPELFLSRSPLGTIKQEAQKLADRAMQIASLKRVLNRG